MSHFLRVLVLFLTLLSHAQAEGKHLFILSGQSNMAGLKPEISFTPAVEAAFGKENVIVVKHALGGQPIRRWYKDWKNEDGTRPEDNGDLYDKLMSKVKPAIKGQTLETITFVWMQGEKDGLSAYTASIYKESLEGLLRQIRADMKREDLYVVIGRINDHLRPRNKVWYGIREAQVEVAEADPRATWVNLDDLNDIERNGEPYNDLHFPPEGYKAMGERFAEAAIDIISKRP